MAPLDKRLKWMNVKQNPFRQIQAHSGIIRHIQESSRHIQAYLEPCVTLTYLKLWCVQNPEMFRRRSIFRTQAYSQLWYIQNPAIFRMLAYLNLTHIQNPVNIYDEALIIFKAIIIFTNYDYFRKACCVEVNILRQFLQRQLCYVKNYGARWGGGRGFLIYSSVYSNKLAYLQLITVLVYGSSPPNSHE